jgi:membrane protein implicated in regulation of membrane protease activity
VVTIGAVVLLAIFVVPAPWGIVLVVSAIAWEIVQKAFWLYRTMGIPVAVGSEALIGRPVTVVSACRPAGRVRLGGESWQARCVEGAGVGESLVIDSVEQITLVVSSRAGLPADCNP